MIEEDFEKLKKYFDTVVIPFYNKPELFGTLNIENKDFYKRLINDNFFTNYYGSSPSEVGDKHLKNALEFGCGNGRWMRYYKKYFDNVDGCDISEKSLFTSQNNLWDLDPKPNFFQVKYDSLSDIPNSYYDFIYSVTVFQHIPIYCLRKRYLEQFYEKLKIGGRIGIQMGGGKVLKRNKYSNYLDNNFDAKSTNSGHDMTCEDENLLIEDLKEIGFKNINIKKSPAGFHFEFNFIARAEK